MLSPNATNKLSQNIKNVSLEFMRTVMQWAG